MATLTSAAWPSAGASSCKSRSSLRSCAAPPPPRPSARRVQLLTPPGGVGSICFCRKNSACHREGEQVLVLIRAPREAGGRAASPGARRGSSKDRKILVGLSMSMRRIGSFPSSHPSDVLRRGVRGRRLGAMPRPRPPPLQVWRSPPRRRGYRIYWPKIRFGMLVVYAITSVFYTRHSGAVEACSKYTSHIPSTNLVAAL